MKNKYFKLLLLAALLLAFGTVAFAQQKVKKPKPIIRSDDFSKPVVNGGEAKNQVKKPKKWRKRCRWVSYRRKGKIRRVRRCVRY